MPGLFSPAVPLDAAPSPAACPEWLRSTAVGCEPAAALQTGNDSLSGGT